MLPNKISITHFGHMEYSQCLALQRDLHAQVTAGEIPNQLLLGTHPSVFTAGRRTLPEERPMDGTPVIDVDRGGKITWHGDGQIIGYPIIALAKRNDVVGYVRTIEAALIETLSTFSLTTTCYPGRTGVWFRDEKHPERDRKIAAIGIRTARGITMHGFSLNVNPDLSNFSKIHPCGFTDTGVTSMSEELGRAITIDEVLPELEKNVIKHLSAISIHPTDAFTERQQEYVLTTHS